MASQPKVSVLMPIWNTHEEHLRESIECILNQTFKDFEFLILNDSPDNTRLDEIVASYSDPRIRYTRNEKNIGITPSRNRLVSAARGEYLAVFDHDDLSHPERLEKQVAYLDAHPEVGVLGSWADSFPVKRPMRFPTDDYALRKALTSVCVMVHPAVMLRKSVLDEHGIRYEEEYTPAEDYRLWLRLMEHTQFHNLPEVLFMYRLHESNTFKRQSTRMMAASRRLENWAQTKYPELYRAHLADCTHIHSVRLFNCIPLLTIKRKDSRTSISLFGVPLLTIKYKKRLPE